MVTQLFKLAFALILIGIVGAQTASAGISTGTGFFVTADGLFLTCFHVVEDARKIVLKDYKGQDYSAEVVAVDRQNDLALLRVQGKFSALPLVDSKTAKRGLSVITLGFPHIDIQGFDPKLTDGLISVSVPGTRIDGSTLTVYRIIGSQIDDVAQQCVGDPPLVAIAGHGGGFLVHPNDAAQTLD